MYDAYSMHKVRYACCVCTICTICTAIVCVVSSSFATDFSTSPRNFLTSEAPQAKASQNCSARSAPENERSLVYTRTRTVGVLSETSSVRLESSTGLRASQAVESGEPILLGGRFHPPEHRVSFLHGDSTCFHVVIRGLRRRGVSFLR